MAADPKLKTIGSPLILGEGPHWDAERQALFYVDIPGQAIFKYTPSDEKVTTCKLPGAPVSLIIPLAGTADKFVISHGRKIKIVTWDGVSTEPTKIEEVCEVDTDEKAKNNRINDGKCDPFGRLYAGTMGPETSFCEFEKDLGSLFLFDLKKREAKKLVDIISLSNGLAWDVERKKFYYIDSLTYRVDQFDYDPETGNISNRKPVVDFKKSGYPGIPDGMCIDTQGCLWIACFNGGRVIRIDPATNRLLKTITIPARQITSVAFGGPNLDVLYVTCASVDTEKDNPKAGYLYEITKLGGYKGIPGVNAKC